MGHGVAERGVHSFIPCVGNITVALMYHVCYDVLGPHLHTAACLKHKFEWKASSRPGGTVCEWLELL